jgi:hypothetical protein
MTKRPLGELTIDEVSALSAERAADLVRQTLEQHPVLQQVYDDAFVQNLIRKRSNGDNNLLFRLVIPDDPIGQELWATIVDEIRELGSNALDTFRNKMRRSGYEALESWRTELWFAAWIKRMGVTVQLEPAVGDGKAEFRAGTEPETWWEIKTPLDVASVRGDNAVEEDIRKRLRFIPEPYALTLEAFDITLTDVAAAVKDLRAQLAKYHGQGGKTPHYFSSNGIVVEAYETGSERGYLGAQLGKMYVWQNQHAELAAKKIREAAKQLPEDGAGVVVIDRTVATWMHDDDVEDACYGELKLELGPSGPRCVRNGGLFRRDSGTRISAVISYSRTIVRHGIGRDIAVLHNPDAKRLLPQELFAGHDVRQTKIRRKGNALVYVLE